MSDEKLSKSDAQKLNRLGSKLVRGSFTKDTDAVQASLELSAAKFQRQADMSFGGSTGGAVGGSETSHVPLLYVDPMFDPILLMFPKDNIKELNRRLRHYYTYHPIVRSAIDLHSEFSLSDFELRCDDKEIEGYYNDFKDRVNLLKLMINLNRDYWLLGESFLYGNWDVSNFEWSSFNQYPPENIDVYRTYAGKDVVYYLKADDELKRIINSPKEVDRAIASSIPAEFLEHMRHGKPFLLANERVIHFARRPSEYSLRGESILKSALKDLLYEDKCFVPGTQVTLASGLKKNIEEIQKGETVVTHLNNNKTVLETSTQWYSGDLIKVNALGNRAFSCTPNHKILTWQYGRTCACGCGKQLDKVSRRRGRSYLKWHSAQFLKNSIAGATTGTDRNAIGYIAAKDLTVNDYVLIPTTTPKTSNIITDNFARILGYYLAEGHIINNKGSIKGVGFTFCKDELKTHIADLVKLIQIEFGVQAHVCEATDSQTASVYVYNALVAHHIKRYATEYAHAKEILEPTFSILSESNQTNILIGYLRGDGRLSKDSNIGATTVSKKLAQQISKMLFNLGIYNSVQYDDTLREFTIKGRPKSYISGPRYHITIPRSQAQNLIALWNYEKIAEPTNAFLLTKINERVSIGMSFSDISDRLAEESFINPRTNTVCWNTKAVQRLYTTQNLFRQSLPAVKLDNYIAVPITAINKEHYEGTVHNLEVSDDNSYTVDDVAVSNCRLLQMTFIDRHTFPIKHWKVGSKEKGWIPSPKHFKALESQLISAMNDPDFNLITHPFVEVEFKSAVTMKEDLIKQFEFIQKRLMMALFVNDGMMGGESAPFASQAVSMKIVMHRYLMNRTLLENTIREKVFLPIAMHRGFIKRTEAELAHNVRTSTRYIIPKFFYTQKLNLMNNTAEQEMLLRLRKDGEIPFEILSDVFGWDQESIKAAFAKEQHTSIDPLWRDARKEAAKDVRVRNQILDGTSMEELTLYDDVAQAAAKVGRPVVPEGDKAKVTPSIVPMGVGENSSRAKATEKGTIPAPMTPAEPGTAPAPTSTTAPTAMPGGEVPK